MYYNLYIVEMLFISKIAYIKNYVNFGTKNNVKFYTKPILKFSLNFPSFLFVVLILSLFLDEILMSRDFPPIMQNAFSGFFSTNYARWFFWFFCCLLVFLLCPKRVLVWGNCCERMRVEIFVRVLLISRVNLIM